ncbi:MAG: hypothetical protein FJ087_10320 [Deltaproteobacteria bacterium]|nr:hypothetical protein [Deltaproteobacteria bacterium]
MTSASVRRVATWLFLALAFPLRALAEAEAGRGAEAAHHGPDWATLGKYGFAFAVVFVALVWFVGPVLRKHYASRHDEVKADIEEAAAAHREAEARLKAAEERLAHLTEETGRLMAEFRGLGEAERDALARQGAVLAQKVRDEMDFSLSQAVKMARTELAQSVVERAFALAEQRVAAEARGPVRDALVEKVVEGITAKKGA